jgi:polyphosphate kinase
MSPNSDVVEDLFLDRDLSWLEFNRRVLHEAADSRTPLLERVMFLSIFTSNLDEFFMKRIEGLRRRIRHDLPRRYAGNMTPKQKLEQIRAVVQPMLQRQAEVYADEILPTLREQGVELLRWLELGPEDRELATAIFQQEIFPALTPLAVDPGHPFPFISNLSTSLALRMRAPGSDESLFARVKIPPPLPQWIPLDETRTSAQYRFVSLVDVIREHLDLLFPGARIERAILFRITRNAEVEPELDPEDETVMEAIEEGLRQRRLEPAVRLEHSGDPDPWMIDLLNSQLKLAKSDVYEMPQLLEYLNLKQIATLPIDELRYSPWNPVTPKSLSVDETDIFAVIRASDMLVHHPYESFNASVMRFIETAAEDPNVLAIKMTVYRIGSDSPFIPMLIRAAEAGKQVACLVELKARFDEQENILIAQQLEKAGVHVVYGPFQLKTHTKTALVVRREPDGVRCYTHIGTGNYHVHTARLYTDVGLLTADPVLTRDVGDLFNCLTGRGSKDDFCKLLVAPVTMKRRFLEMIYREIEHLQAGRPARIVAKMNQLEDVDICNALYEASQAGLSIDLIIRGFCVLKPGVPGVSDNIRVLSVIGRFLEHSRIYHFRNGAESDPEGEFYIGSADWMPRNLERRVEAVTPVDAPDLRARLWEILEVHLRDQRSAWDMHADGSYTQRSPPDDGDPSQQLGSQQTLILRTLAHHGSA